MKSSHRHTALSAVLVACSLAGASLGAQQAAPAQRGGQPKPDTPNILVTTFHSNDRLLGVQAADEVRKRLQNEHSAQELFVTTKKAVDGTLEVSGYRADSALSAGDLMELAKQVHGDYVLDGTVMKMGTTIRMQTRLLLKLSNQIFAQPLPDADGKDVGDAAKMVERYISDALKGMPPYKACINDLRAAKNDEAIKDAKLAITAYPSSTLARLCMITAYDNLKSPPDDIIAVAEAILKIDSTSTTALGFLSVALTAKGDTNRAIATNIRLWRVDPTNQSVVQSIIQQLANSGSPKDALPMIDTLLVANPGDPQLLKTKWLVLLKAKQYKQAILTGEEYVKADTTQATLDYFQRQIGAAQADSNAAAIQQFASRAGQKFPKDVSFPLLLAQTYRKAGQLQQSLQAARRATEIEPKNTNAWLFAVVVANELNQPDTAMAIANAAIAAGADKATLGPALLGPVGEAIKKAQASKLRADWEAALKSAEVVDAIAPTANTKFYVGISAFSIGADMMEEVQKAATAAQKPKAKKEDIAAACAAAKAPEDYFAKTMIAMPVGGSVDKAVAAQILTAVGSYGDYLTQVKKFACR